MKLGIVGHGQDKFTPHTEALARQAIIENVLHSQATAIVSGRSPMGGVDYYAEDVAAEFNIPTIIHEPTHFHWDGIGGFKWRNQLIAEDSDLVLVVVVREYPANYHGMTFKRCYHCKHLTPPHVKSGACWTAWRAKKRKWVIIG